MVVRIGCLAIQGGFSEHLALLRRCTAGGAAPEAVEVRTAEELASVDGLVIPGGESTAMAKVSEWNDLTDKLRAFACSGKPIWGTCAGLIFLGLSACGGMTLRECNRAAAAATWAATGDGAGAPKLGDSDGFERVDRNR